MADTWITDMTHYLDERGCIPEGLPGPARKLADHLGAIVIAETMRSHSPGERRVRCRRRPGRRACEGEIVHWTGEDGRIEWCCEKCGDNGLISNWEGTPWDCSTALPVQ